MKPVYRSTLKELLELKTQMNGETVSIPDLAKAVGVSRQTIHCWMAPRGVKMLPTAERQVRLEQFFGVSFKRIWTLDDGGGNGK